MKLTTFNLTLAACICGSSAFGAISSKAAFDSANIEAGGAGTSADYYASGNDDSFGEYGIATFNFSSADFGGPVSGVNSATYTLTHNDRNFSDGASFEIFFTTDDFDASYTGLSFDNSGANNPGGLNLAQFTTIFSLGSFAYTAEAGGELEDLVLVFAGAAMTALMNEINTGSDFSLLIVADTLSGDATFSGVGNTFDPGDPTLSINATAVPEPSTYALLASVATLGVVIMRRRRR